MRIIAIKTIKEYLERFPVAKQFLLAWYNENENTEWNHPNELKEQCRNTSMLTDKRVVFNIHGNSYRLIVDVEYRLKIVFVVWFGTHQQYDKFDAKKIKYDKANKK